MRIRYYQSKGFAFCKRGRVLIARARTVQQLLAAVAAGKIALK